MSGWAHKCIPHRHPIPPKSVSQFESPIPFARRLSANICWLTYLWSHTRLDGLFRTFNRRQMEISERLIKLFSVCNSVDCLHWKISSALMADKGIMEKPESSGFPIPSSQQKVSNNNAICYLCALDFLKIIQVKLLFNVLLIWYIYIFLFYW